MAAILGLILFSFFITALLIVPAINLLYKIRLQRRDQQTRTMLNERTPIFDKYHGWKIGTPVGGGLIVMTVVAALFLFVFWFRSVAGIPNTAVFDSIKEMWILSVTFVSFGLLGLYDDVVKTFGSKSRAFWGLRFRYKFFFQWVLAFLIASMMYWMLGISVVNIPSFATVSLGVLFIPFAAFVIVSFANAFNITDGLDGLGTGLLLIALLAFLAISSAILDSVLSIFIGLWIGALFAFLYFNIFPARLWLGDVGTMSFGATLAVIGLLLGKTIALGVIGGVFVIEVGSSLIQLVGKRTLGRKLLLVAPLHLFFQARGWPEPKVVMRFWLMGAIFAIFGLWTAFLTG
ncbi:MAG: hypothetical protein Q8R11_04260 [bacterium]|nr:hypothetical protein [bacterium]